MPANERDLLLEPFVEIFVTRATLLSSCVLVIWDHITTFDLEVELIWQKPWSSTATMYMLTRYIGDMLGIFNIAVNFMNTPSAVTCETYFRFHIWFTLCLSWSAQLTLALRVASLYGRSRAITVGLTIQSVVSTMVASALLEKMQTEMRTSAEPWPGIYVCAPTYIPLWCQFIPIPMLMFDLTLLVLAIAACVSEFDHIREVRRQFHRYSLFVWMLWDTLCYFSINIIIVVISIVVARYNPLYSRLHTGYGSAAICIAGSRLVLNLRRVYYKDHLRAGIRGNSLEEMDLRVSQAVRMATESLPETPDTMTPTDLEQISVQGVETSET